MKRPAFFILCICVLLLTSCSSLFPRYDTEWIVTYAVRRDVFEQYYKMDNMKTEYIDGLQYVVFSQETGRIPFSRLPDVLKNFKIDNLWDYNTPVFQLVEIEEDHEGVYETYCVKIITSDLQPPAEGIGNTLKLQVTARVPGNITNHKRANGGEMSYTFNDLSSANELEIQSRVFNTSLAAGYVFIALIFILLVVFLLGQMFSKLNSMIVAKGE